MSISPLWYYNSKRAFSINNVEGEYLSVLRGLDVEGVPYLQGWSAAPALSPPLSVSVFLYRSTKEENIQCN